MASELRVNTLKDASGNNSIATSFVAGGSAKAWINLNGSSTVATRDTLNVSSLADEGTGQYLISFSSSMGNDDYTISGGARSPGVASGVLNAPSNAAGDMATGSIEVYALGLGDGNPADFNHVFTIIHGDLA